MLNISVTPMDMAARSQLVPFLDPDDSQFTHCRKPISHRQSKSLKLKFPLAEGLCHPCLILHLNSFCLFTSALNHALGRHFLYLDWRKALMIILSGWSLYNCVPLSVLFCSLLMDYLSIRTWFIYSFISINPHVALPTAFAYKWFMSLLAHL